jgi:drug/metabolite transporter, DME family
VLDSELQVGIAYALLAGILWGVGPLLLKRALKHTNVSTATLLEQNVSVLLLVGLATYSGEIREIDFTSPAFWAFVLAGAVGASFGKVFYYKGIDKVGASKATSVKNSSPFLTTILAVLFLGESASWLLLAGVALIVFGVVVLTQSTAAGERGVDRLQYFLYPIIAAFCFGVNPIFKKFGIDAAGLPVLGTMTTQVSALIFMLLFARAIGLQIRWQPVPAKALILCTLSGITEGLGSLFTFFALAHGPAALLSPIWRISPLVTFALARFTLKGIEVVTVRDGIAAALIVAGVFLLSRS